MGVQLDKKILKHDGLGNLSVEKPILDSSGSADAGKLPALNANGVLDSTILNGTTISDNQNSSGKTVILDSTGKIDKSVLPDYILAFIL